MSFAARARRIASRPPQVTAQRIAHVVTRAVSHWWRRRRDRGRTTFVEAVPFDPSQPARLFGDAQPAEWTVDEEALAAVCRLYLDHRFDLLGSGWIRVAYGMRCPGLEGRRYDMSEPVSADPEGRWLAGRVTRANLAESQRLWRLVDEGYQPIDWHVDFRSGHRWRPDAWCLQSRWTRREGADVKVPWELGRMQHLPQLALACVRAAAGKAGFGRPQAYAREFRNQVLDFLAANPPRMGVQWAVSMEVGIRVANWLVAYDLFRAARVEFDEPFRRAFLRGVYQHGRHIVRFLEWTWEQRSNHYLANIAGLLFAAVCLPRCAETDAWLAFGVQELVKETAEQFHPDGTNFEGSTCYHRLSGELVTYASALVLGLREDKRAALAEYDHRLHRGRPKLAPAPLPLYPVGWTGRKSPLPAWLLQRLEKAAEFTMHVTRPHGRVSQFGDNDSGRLLKLDPAWRKMTVAEARARYANLAGYDELEATADYWDDDALDHRHLVGAVNGLFARPDFAAFAGDRADTAAVRALARGTRANSYRDARTPAAAEAARVGYDHEFTDFLREAELCETSHRQEIEIPAPGDLREGLRQYAYPDFGLYVFRSERLYLAVRCGAVGQNGYGGHSHNDQLSIELSLDGRLVIADPGTYLYTPLGERRNEYRSVAAHFAPRIADREPARLTEGLFALGGAVAGECRYWGPLGFAGSHAGYGRAVAAAVQVLQGAVRLVYSSDGPPLDKLPVPEIGGQDVGIRRPERGASSGTTSADLGRGCAFSDGYGKRRGAGGADSSGPGGRGP